VRRFDEAITAHTQAADIYHNTSDRHREATALASLGAAPAQGAPLRRGSLMLVTGCRCFY
jgi:hypothetical protein